MSQKPTIEDLPSSDDEKFEDAVGKPANEAAAAIDEILNKQFGLGEDKKIESENEKKPDKDDEDENFKDCDNDSEIDNDESSIDDELQKKFEEKLTIEEKQENKQKSEELKIKGNELFKNEEYVESIETYTSALRICPVDCANERSILYGNRAAAKIKIDSKKSAIDDCSKALEFNPNYMRALLRRAKLYEDLNKLDECLEDFKKAVELDPGNAEGRAAMVRLPPLINQRNEELKEEMMQKLKSLGNTILKPFGLSTNNFQMQQDPNTGGYSINFNQNAK